MSSAGMAALAAWALVAVASCLLGVSSLAGVACSCVWRVSACTLATCGGRMGWRLACGTQRLILCAWMLW